MGSYRVIIALSVLVVSCNGSDPLDKVEYNPHSVTINIPDPSFPPVPINPANPLTEEGIALGKRLYYDPIIDGKGNRSCSSCHFQEKSFSSGKAVLAHVNLGFDEVFLWKGDFEGDIEDAMRFEVTDFFGTDVAKLNTHEDYPTLFKEAFNITDIEQEHVAFALAQFLKTVNSYNSKYDQYKRGETSFTKQERLGEYLFFSEKGDCFHCHSAPLFKDNQLHNNGLNLNHSREEDQGHFLISRNPTDSGKFKTPTLRNIELTAPYMHDGRYATLEEVVLFYSFQVENNQQVDPLMKKAHQGGLKLEPDEISALVAFMKTLTDQEFIENPLYAP